MRSPKPLLRLLSVLLAGTVAISPVSAPAAPAALEAAPVVVKAEARPAAIGHTEIMKWQHGRKTAISITYDGGTINQFRVALPIMNQLKFPATFFIVTGDITGSQYKAKFPGRPLEEIVRESATVPVSEANFFERATAVRFLPYENIVGYHTRAGDFFELGKIKEAHAEIEEAYAKVRRAELKPGKGIDTFDNETVDVTWSRLKEIADQGHEFASHSVSHPQLAIVDDLTMTYELHKSREELLNHLGPKHTFSCECPHGSENPRVMKYSQAAYPALRNRMPEPFLDEINRWSKKDPAQCKKEYVQWQRGPKTSTPLEEMKGWVDVCLAHDNFWLVLTFHGIDGIGYQPKTGEEVRDYFTYFKKNEDRVWVATFQDVTKYIRQRMNGNIAAVVENNRIQVALTHFLDPQLYDLPLTLKTYLPHEWKKVMVRQGETTQQPAIQQDEAGQFVLYLARPNAEPLYLQQDN